MDHNEEKKVRAQVQIDINARVFSAREVLEALRKAKTGISPEGYDKFRKEISKLVAGRVNEDPYHPYKLVKD